MSLAFGMAWVSRHPAHILNGRGLSRLVHDIIALRVIVRRPSTTRSSSLRAALANAKEKKGVSGGVLREFSRTFQC